MGEITRRAGAELRQLPLMLGKLAGGIAAVIGFTAAVVIVTRRPGGAMAGLLPALLAGLVGVAVFVLAGRALRRRLTAEAAPAAGARTSLLAWGLLLIGAVVFLAWTWFVTR